MPDLLLELRSEEIPARMQRKAAGDLRKMVTDGLVEAGLTYEGCQEYWTPRRLVLDMRGVTARSRDVREEIKGPSTKAPEQAVQGFLRKAGLSDVSQAHVHSDPKKGDFYVAHIVKPGRAAEEVIAGLVPAVIRDFPWPKSMRWGKASAEPGSLRWVRPLQSIVCTFGPETEEPTVVDFAVDGIRSGNVTYGHRFHSPGAISVRRFEDYAAKLEAAKVIVDAERRKKIILADAQNLAFANGLQLVEDDALLEEVSGLVEWPVVLMGEFEEAFLDIPAEVIRLTIRANQKCFVTRPHDADGVLSNRFVLTANIEAKDGGREISYGNGKVVRARLSDALYFWKTDQGDLPDLGELEESAKKFDLDLRKPLDQRMARLDHLGVTFHAKLGTQGERVERIRRLAEELAPIVSRPSTSPLWGGRAEGAGGGLDNDSLSTPTPALRADPPHKGEGVAALVRRAAVLAKADLTTEVVGEFPELQGAMGRKYALLQGEHPSVAAAIEEHYKPQGPSDRVPTDPVSVAVALADKLDTLVGFWAIDEKPTGSKDPYALRRAALGVIRIVVENALRAGLIEAILDAFTEYLTQIKKKGELHKFDQEKQTIFTFDQNTDYDIVIGEKYIRSSLNRNSFMFARKSDLDIWESLRRTRPFDECSRDLLSFFHDRLKVYLRDQGARHDLIDAVLASGTAPTSPLRGGRDPEGGAGGGIIPQPSQPYDVEQGHSSTPTPALRADPPLKGEGGAANDDLLMIVRRVEALGTFLDTEDGKNLLAGTKRAANILAAEEKKGTRIAEKVDPALFNTPDEEVLFAAINRAEKEAGYAIEQEDFSAAMRSLSELREPVDSFFERVLVNDEDLDVRANRLALLARIRTATGQVADFSRIAG